jgi:hypothetical protein
LGVSRIKQIEAIVAGVCDPGIPTATGLTKAGYNACPIVARAEAPKCYPKTSVFEPCPERNWDAGGKTRGGKVMALVARHGPIDRLPESQRLPIVLCDHEGLTYDQAARQLRWTVPTLRCRLAKARQRLKGRLTRRGFVGAAAGAALAANEARALVPPVLMRSTVLAATGASASAGVALLTQVLLREMLMTKVKFVTTAALATLALASAGVIAAAGRYPTTPSPP